MIPIVELAYSTVASASGVRNGGATTRKTQKITTAPSAAPISGRMSRRCTRFRSLTRSSRTTLWLATSRSVCVLMIRSLLPVLPGSGLGQVGYGVDVGLIDERRARQSGLTAADQVLVVDVEPQRVDCEVALQERLLIDRPLDLARLDRVDQCGVRVEGDHLCLAARV